jgi:hypothetical protein
VYRHAVEQEGSPMLKTRALAVTLGLGVLIGAFLAGLGGTTRPARAVAPNVERTFQTVAGVVACPGPFTLPLTLAANVLLLLDIDAEIYGSPLDSRLTVVGPSPATTLVGQNDDDPLSLDSALGVVIPAAGSYTIQISDFAGVCGPGHFFLLSGTIVPLQ